MWDSERLPHYYMTKLIGLSRNFSWPPTRYGRVTRPEPYFERIGPTEIPAGMADILFISAPDWSVREWPFDYEVDSPFRRCWTLQIHSALPNNFWPKLRLIQLDRPNVNFPVADTPPTPEPAKYLVARFYVLHPTFTSFNFRRVIPPCRVQLPSMVCWSELKFYHSKSNPTKQVTDWVYTLLKWCLILNGIWDSQLTPTIYKSEHGPLCPIHYGCSSSCICSDTSVSPPSLVLSCSAWSCNWRSQDLGRLQFYRNWTDHYRSWAMSAILELCGIPSISNLTLAGWVGDMHFNLSHLLSILPVVHGLYSLRHIINTSLLTKVIIQGTSLVFLVIGYKEEGARDWPQRHCCPAYIVPIYDQQRRLQL